MSTFVLIHGAWHGAWCWHKVVPLLKHKGHHVTVLDLPGHGIDRTPLANVTLESYANRVCQAIDAATEPVILVGHSMGGFVISQAAELRPQKIKRLVYLAAVLAENGTILTQFAQSAAMFSSGGLIVAEDQSSISLSPGTIRESFYADCSDADVALAESVLTPQPMAPFQTAQRTTPENWGQIPRYYIECLQDNALPLEMQRRCCQQLPCEKVFSMDTSHSPFFSAPEALVEHLLT